MKIGKWLSKQKNEPIIEEDDDILVRDEWYQYYTECARKLRLILRIIDVCNQDGPEKMIKAHIDIRKLADVLDPDEKEEWFRLTNNNSKNMQNGFMDNKPKKKKPTNKRRRELYDWLKRAEAVNIDPLPMQRPGLGQRKKWEQSVVSAEKLSRIKELSELQESMVKAAKPPQSQKVSFDIGEYKRECINTLKSVEQGSSLLVEDRIYQTVHWWIKGLWLNKEFDGKMFHVEEIDHNNQRIWRVK